MSDFDHNAIVSYIWGIASDVLRDRFVRGKYRDVILPMTVLRRLDAVLEPTKDAVLKMAKSEAGKSLSGDALKKLLCKTAQCGFYNTSPYTMADLTRAATLEQLEANFEAYLKGFSSDVQEILVRFNFYKVIFPKLLDVREAETDNGSPRSEILTALLGKFLSPSLNLSPYPKQDGKGNEIPGLDNHAMGTVFEELLRRFNEDNNEEAGEHFTPRDIVTLMADIIFEPIADELKHGTYSLYDGACGTGGMLTVGEERLIQLAKEKELRINLQLFGQEISDETYAIAKADALIKGRSDNEFHISCASTLSADAFYGKSFNFMMSNPPYGKSWGEEVKKMTPHATANKKDIMDDRFVKPGYANEPDFAMLPDAGDGQLLFLLNMVAKMKTDELGSRFASVHNGSSLFTGNAGQGESNARRYLLENDLVEAIIQLPEKIFYNTGISTYIWLLTNRKKESMRGKVQLIDASHWCRPLRKNLGQRNCEMADEDRARVLDLILHPRDTDNSIVLRNEELGYRAIGVERPLRLAAELSAERMGLLKEQLPEKQRDAIITALSALPLGSHPWNDIETALKGIKLTKKVIDVLQKGIGIKSPDAPILGKDTAGLPLADSDLHENEQVALTETVADFMEREVLPYAPDAFVPDTEGKIGYEISFNRYFYKPEPLRSVADIIADIRALEKGNDAILDAIIGRE